MNRVTLLRGSIGFLETQAAFAEEGDPQRLRLDIRAEPPIPWAGLRLLLGRLRESLGDERVDQALAPHRAMVSLVLRGLLPHLDPAERTQRETLCAHTSGFLTHNFLIAWPLREAWLRSLAPLCQDIEILVPDVSAVDFQSMVVFWSLLREQPTLRYTLGQDPERLPEEALWRRRVHVVFGLVEQLEAAVDLTEVRLISTPGGHAPDPAPAATSVHPLDDRLEERAFQTLESSRPEAELVLQAMEAAFACLGFTTSLRLGLELLAADRVTLSAGQRARVHTLIALSAYNRQVGSRGESTEADVALAELLDEHFRAALEGETDPALRAHLLYRLAINAGRRQDDVKAALPMADSAVTEAGRAGSRFIEAWTRNGRAFLYARLGRLQDAEEECERAITNLEEEVDGPLESERLMSRVVLSDNLAEIHIRAGDLEQAYRSQSNYQKLVDKLPGPRLPSPRWLDLHRKSLRLQEAVAVAEHGLELAESLLDPLGGEIFALALGDLYYRRGQAREAWTTFCRTLAMHRRIAEPDEIWATEMACAMAASRAGLLDRAESDLCALLEHPSGQAVETRSEILAALGVLRARQRDISGSEEVINDAIAAAVSCGERDVLLRVACAAGEACLLLDRRDGAEEAFDQALEIAQTGDGLSPADLFAVLMGRMRTIGPDAEHLALVLELLEAALEEPEAWWELPPLAQLCRQQPPDSDLTLLHRALAERVDVPE